MVQRELRLHNKDWNELWRSQEFFRTPVPAREQRDTRIARIAFLISFIALGIMAAAALTFVIMVLWRLFF